MNRPDDTTFYDDVRKTIPLGPWLDLCAAAGVPHVPATFSAAFDRMELYACLDGHPCERLDAALSWLETEVARRIAAGERCSVRYEDGSNGGLKHAAAQGRTWAEDDAFHKIEVDDPRIFDVIVTEPVRVCVRPWVDPHRIDGYPLELRVFWGPTRYGKDGIQGVSSYYPQRPLPNLEDFIQFTGTKRRAMIHLLEDVIISVRLLAHLKHFPVGFTADFIVSEDGQVLFLEGGPPHHDRMHHNAHPCCFAPGQVEGVALSKRVGALDE